LLEQGALDSTTRPTFGYFLAHQQFLRPKPLRDEIAAAFKHP
jgi:hypothetical protein